MSWADAIREARGSLTQVEAAAAISSRLSVRTLQDWELGRNKPPEWVQDLVLGVLRGRRGKKRSDSKRRAKSNEKALRSAPTADVERRKESGI
jgi:hypothetical protein